VGARTRSSRCRSSSPLPASTASSLLAWKLGKTNNVIAIATVHYHFVALAPNICALEYDSSSLVADLLGLCRVHLTASKWALSS